MDWVMEGQRLGRYGKDCRVGLLPILTEQWFSFFPWGGGGGCWKGAYNFFSDMNDCISSLSFFLSMTHRLVPLFQSFDVRVQYSWPRRHVQHSGLRGHILYFWSRWHSYSLWSEVPTALKGTHTSLNDQRHLSVVYTCMNGTAPQYLQELIPGYLPVRHLQSSAQSRHGMPSVD